jgi:hypothetical protein
MDTSSSGFWRKILELRRDAEKPYELSGFVGGVMAEIRNQNPPNMTRDY